MVCHVILEGAANPSLQGCTQDGIFTRVQALSADHQQDALVGPSRLEDAALQCSPGLLLGVAMEVQADVRYHLAPAY